jgi:hypothetical protein
MKKELTKEQRGYIETILKTISKEVGGLDNIKLKDTKCTYIKFHNHNIMDTLHVENLKKILIRGTYGDMDAIYMLNRRDTFQRMIKGEPFTIETESSV